MKRLELESTRTLIEAAHDQADKESVPGGRGNGSRSSTCARPSSTFAKDQGGSRREIWAGAPAHQDHRGPDGRREQGLPARDRHQSPDLREQLSGARRDRKVADEHDGEGEAERDRALEAGGRIQALRAHRGRERARCTSSSPNVKRRSTSRDCFDPTTSACSSVPITPGSPASPKPMQNLLIALACGFGLGIVLAFAIETLDNTLKTQIDVETFSGRAGPRADSDHRAGQARPERQGARTGRATSRSATATLGIFREPRSMAAECCRSIRTNILFMSPDHPIRTMVITSPSPQEGKTTTAINLAIAMAEAGGRVLLIDTDMRRPRLHRSFAVPNQVGVSTLILGNTTLEDAVKHTDIPNLDVLTLRSHPAQSLGVPPHQALCADSRGLQDAL